MHKVIFSSYNFFVAKSYRVDWEFQRCAIAEETAGWSRGCNGDGRCIRREKSPGIALHRGGHATPALLDYGGIVMDQLRVPTRHGKCPPYMKIIFPSAESRARAMIDIYSSGCPGIYCIVLWKSVRASESLSSIENLDVGDDWSLFAPRHDAETNFAKAADSLDSCKRIPRSDYTNVSVITNKYDYNRNLNHFITKIKFREKIESTIVFHII